MNVYIPQIPGNQICFESFLRKITHLYGKFFISEKIDQFEKKFPSLIFNYPNVGKFDIKDKLISYSDKYQSTVNTIHGINETSPKKSKPYQRLLIEELDHFDGILYSYSKNQGLFYYFLIRILQGKAEIDTVKGFFDSTKELDQAVEGAINIVRDKVSNDIFIEKTILLGTKDIVNTTFCVSKSTKTMLAFKIDPDSLKNYHGQKISADNLYFDQYNVIVDPKNGITNLLLSCSAAQFDQMILNPYLYRNITALTPASRLQILSKYPQLL